MASSAKKKAVDSKKVIAKPTKKPVVKTVAKVATKTVAKAAAKPVAKVTAKSATSAATKAVPKVASKPVAPAAVVKPLPAAKVSPSKPAPTPPPIPVNSSSLVKPVPKTNTATAIATPPKAVVLTMNAHKKYAGLTEAEIVKQPESEYMSKAQLAFFKEKLTELRGTIIHNATDTGEHLRDVEVATDPSDRATQEEEYTLELRTRDRERKLLKKVDKVLRMIDDGSFGWCEETGEPIGLPRLIARPTATLSIEAQERRERKQKLFGD
jgi:DnaK suppressor protein